MLEAHDRYSQSRVCFFRLCHVCLVDPNDPEDIRLRNRRCPRVHECKGFGKLSQMYVLQRVGMQEFLQPRSDPFMRKSSK